MSVPHRMLLGVKKKISHAVFKKKKQAWRAGGWGGRRFDSQERIIIFCPMFDSRW